MHVLNRSNHTIVITEQCAFLLSYNTLICSYDESKEGSKDGAFKRHWAGYSRTTASHIREFLFNMDLLHKKYNLKANWEALPVFPAELVLAIA